MIVRILGNDYAFLEPKHRTRGSFDLRLLQAACQDIVGVLINISKHVDRLASRFIILGKRNVSDIWIIHDCHKW